MSTAIDEATVRRIARLARLALTDDEVRRFTDQLGAILDYMQQLRDVDTTGVEPLHHPIPLSNVTRDDEPGEPLGVERALANAPERHGDFFRVPAVLEGDAGA